MLFTASDLILQNPTAEACSQLKDALSKADGIATPPDFVAGTALPGVISRINAILQTLGCN